MRKMTDSLVERGGREDLPTGSTPRKRVWQYTDNWELTKDRDTIIQGWKRRAVQSQENEDGDEDEDDSESSSALRDIPRLPPSDSSKQLPLPSVTVQPEDISEPLDPMPPPYLEADPQQPPTSNRPIQLASSIVPSIALSSAASNPVIKAKMGKAVSEAVPAMGTLTERSTNLIYGRGSRRAR
jgi:kinesin family protein 11